jgi:hypothetical protein
MMTDEEIDTLAGPQKLFIAELQSWPGNSGSPVFLSLGGVRGSVIIAGENFRFLGLVLGGYKNEFGASVVGEPGKMLEFGNELPIGVSFIVPASRLREVLDSPAAQSRRGAESRVTVLPGK